MSDAGSCSGSDDSFVFGSDDGDCWQYDEDKESTDDEEAEQEVADSYKAECKGFTKLNKVAARRAEEEELERVMREATVDSLCTATTGSGGGSAAEKRKLQEKADHIMALELQKNQNSVLADGGDKFSIPADRRAAQRAIGPQSTRGTSWTLPANISGDSHAKACFEQMLEKEREMCGDWAVFYHSYGFAALLYEVQGVLARELFGYAEATSLPRLNSESFKDYQDASSLRQDFSKFGQRDHSANYRGAAICVTTSLMDTNHQSEAPPTQFWHSGYQGGDAPDQPGILKKLLLSAGAPEASAQKMTNQLLATGTEYGLGGGKGHMLQFFIRRSVVDSFAYPALPYGQPDNGRLPFDKYLAGKGPIVGQARIVCNPPMLVNRDLVRINMYSSNAAYLSRRPALQKRLVKELDCILGSPLSKAIARAGLHPPPPQTMSEAQAAPTAKPGAPPQRTSQPAAGGGGKTIFSRLSSGLKA